MRSLKLIADPWTPTGFRFIDEILPDLPDDWNNDPSEHDGEWHAIITLAHEVVEWEGYGIPAFEGDLERFEWERQRGLRS